MQTFALLGAHPALSLAEIAAVTGCLPTGWSMKKDNSEASCGIALFEDAQWNFQVLQNTLGGSQKLGVVVGVVDKLNINELTAFLAADLVEQVPEGKVHFGLSIYSDDVKKLDQARATLKNLGYELKTFLKNSGRSARYVISKDATLSSVVLKNNDLLTKGAEFVFLIRENDIVIGKTLAAQDVDEWSHRDMDRPRRNAKQGMLPPKLARMMVNIATPRDCATHKGGVINPALANAQCGMGVVLDPFCGSGTVLMESGLLGATGLIGGDVAQMAVSDTAANLEWLRKEHPELPEPTLYTMRASDLAEALPEESVDAIITETYLGRPRKGGESKAEIEETLEYVKTLYTESFSALKKVLKPGAVVVLACPVHMLDQAELTFDAVSLMTSLGYTHEPLPFEPIIYRHQNQLVGRKILKFTRSL